MAVGDDILRKHVPLATPKTQQKNPKPHNNHHHPELQQKKEVTQPPTPKHHLWRSVPSHFIPHFPIENAQQGWAESRLDDAFHLGQ